MNEPKATTTTKSPILRNTAIITCLILIGLIVVPYLVYVVGSLIINDYAGGSFADFFGTLHWHFRQGQWPAVFLLLSPLIIWPFLILAFRGFWRK